MSGIYLILVRNERDMTTDVYWSLTAAVILVRFSWNLNFLDRFSKNPQTWNFANIYPMAAELSHADGRTDRYDEINNCAPKMATSFHSIFWVLTRRYQPYSANKKAIHEFEHKFPRATLQNSRQQQWHNARWQARRCQKHASFLNCYFVLYGSRIIIRLASSWAFRHPVSFEIFKVTLNLQQP